MGAIGPGLANSPQATSGSKNSAPTQYFHACYMPNHCAEKCRVDIVKNVERVKNNYEKMPLLAKATMPPLTY